jgi:hypothetical protein
VARWVLACRSLSRRRQVGAPTGSSDQGTVITERIP